MSELSDNVAVAFKLVNEQRETISKLQEILRAGVHLSGGWREAIVELEDWCHEPVRLRNMLAAADQLDEWKKRAKDALKEQS